MASVNDGLGNQCVDAETRIKTSCSSKLLMAARRCIDERLFAQSRDRTYIAAAPARTITHSRGGSRTLLYGMPAGAVGQIFQDGTPALFRVNC